MLGEITGGARLKKGNIICIGKDGASRTFYYNCTVSRLPNLEYHLTIYASSDYSDHEFFEIIAKEKDNTHLKITSIFKNDDALYGAKGIPDSAIPELKVLSGLNICSSSQEFPTDPNERRTEYATKYWKRLEKNGQAEYDSKSDVYTSFCTMLRSS
jgi:hypothetical protein